MNKILFLAALFFLSSCASIPLTPEAEKLIIVNDVKYVSYCTKVGFVQASSTMGSDAGFTSVGNSNSLVQMKNMAARMGDVLLLTKSEESAFSGSEREGVVYKCPPNIVFKVTK